MSAAGDEAARLRRCRLLFEQAQTAHCSMGEALRREVEARWAAADRRLVDRRCGTVDASTDEGRPLDWWQR